MTDWTELNLAHWDERAAPHAASEGYAVQRFLDDPGFLSDVVTFDRAGWATSPGCAAFTCSATSVRTPCRCTGSAPG